MNNWKTSSIGLTMIAGAVIHLVFAIQQKKADEQTWTITVGAIVAGLGFIFSRDASSSQKALSDIQSQLDTHASAIRTGDSSLLQNPVAPTKPTI